MTNVISLSDKRRSKLGLASEMRPKIKPRIKYHNLGWWYIDSAYNAQIYSQWYELITKTNKKINLSVRNGVYNLSPEAVNDLKFGKDFIGCDMTFRGEAVKMFFFETNILGLYCSQ